MKPKRTTKVNVGKKKNLIMEERSSMVLFSGPTCPESHCVRFVFSEKDVAYNLLTVPNLRKPPEDLIALNPQGNVPTLSDRNLMLYKPRIISEYIDERFPYPPLMPVEPMPRAHLRLALHHVEEHWYPCLKRILTSNALTADKARKKLKEDILARTDMFGMKRFFLSDEFSLLDCAIGPVLWRLSKVGIELPPKQARTILRYRDQIFSRPGFIRSLTREEQDMYLS